MTWTLKSGRKVRGKPDTGHRRAADNHALYTTFFPTGGDDLTPAERREIAAAVKACWDRWAETGEP